MNSLSILAAVAAVTVCGDLTVSTDFEGGSAKIVGTDPDQQVVRLSPAGDPREGWPCWWYARIDGLRPGQPLTLKVIAPVVKMPDNASGPGKPLISDWALPTRVTYSADGKEWQHTDPGKRVGETSTYTIPAGGATVWVAWGPPFTPKDSAELVAFAEKATPAAKGFELCRSNANRPVLALRVREGNVPDGKRPAVWVEARQHAWEAGSSWVGMGFVEWLVGADPRAVWVRKNADVYVIPVMDVDHVATGNGGKEAVPRDHNRDWSDQPHWAEVRASQVRLRGLAKEGRLDLFLALHNPAPRNAQPFFFVNADELLAVPGRRSLDRWLAAARAEIADPFELAEKPRSAGPGYHPLWRQISGAWVQANGNPHTVAVCLETPWNTPQCTTKGYRAVGRQLGLAVERYLRDRPAP